MCTPYAKWAHGVAERMNRTCTNILKTLCRDLRVPVNKLPRVDQKLVHFVWVFNVLETIGRQRCMSTEHIQDVFGSRLRFHLLHFPSSLVFECLTSSSDMFPIVLDVMVETVTHLRAE